jgi:CRP/FNR family transcriptional regulator
MLDKCTYQPYEALFREADPGTHLFALRTGQVKLTSSLADGREQIIRVAVAGQLVGFETLSDQAYPYTATTLTRVTACRITHKDMLCVLEAHPTVSLRVIHKLNQELERAQVMIRDLGLKRAIEKVASFILSLVPPRGLTPTELLLPLSRQEIAEMLGLTEETVSRTMAEFKRDGLILAPRGRIRILDQAQLQKLAGTTCTPATGNNRAASVN